MSKKQTVTATSTCDSEYIAAAACTRHVTWVRNLLQCLNFLQISPTLIYCDNQVAISLTKDFQFHAKSKHIDIHVHLIHDKVSDGTVLVSYVPSDENLADVLTKGLAWLKHEKFTPENGLMPAWGGVLSEAGCGCGADGCGCVAGSRAGERGTE